MHQTLPDEVKPPRGWPLFLAGAVLFVLGPIGYVIQFEQAHFTTPWYLPILSTLGVLLMAASVFRSWSVLRTIGVVVFALICGLEWFVFAVATKTPPYAGPAIAGARTPAFSAKLADGQTFTDRDLARGTPTILLFYRGHW